MIPTPSVLAVVLTTSFLVAGSGAVASEPLAASGPLATAEAGSTVELNLSGVDAEALATLPEVAPLPAEQAVEATPPPSARSALGAAPAVEAPAPAPDVLTAPLETEPFSVLGVTWDRGPTSDDVVVRYRVKQEDVWSEWEAVGVSDVSPDPDTPDAEQSGTREATDAIVAVAAEGVQIWAESTAGDVRGLEAVLIDPGTRPQDAAPAAASGVAETRTAAYVEAAPPPAPTIISRAGWGADESRRTCLPDLSTEVVAAAIHHTASSNGYAAADVPALIRGFYEYHTRPEASGGRGWCDIGYNFLVDQYGRIWEGRAGGIDVAVVGVHTGGFNSRTFAVSAIGSYDSAAPTAAMTEAISRTVAWKFAMHRIPGSGTATMVSGGGASKYPAGTVVTFPTIFGHRDAQLTSCPGQLLYNQLGAIRARVSALADADLLSTPIGAWDSRSTTSSSLSVRGWLIDPDTSAPVVVRVSVDGVETSATADIDRPDVATAVPGYGSRHGFAVTIPARAGVHAVCIRATNVGAGADRLIGCRWMTVENAVPVGQIDSIVLGVGTATVTGWTLDPDTDDPIQAHVLVDGGPTAVTADLPRGDLGRYFDTTNHGFRVTVPVPSGAHRICLHGINVPAGNNPAIVCRVVTMPDKAPIGQLESVTLGTGTATVKGWALDPDTTSPIAVHVTVDGRPRAATANIVRSDLGRYFATTNHGYQVTVPLTPGTRRICVYAIDVPVGPNPELGCRTVVVTTKPPIGQVDSVRLDGTAVVVSGWALDPDTTAPIQVHVYVGSGAKAAIADRPRPDLARYFATTNHGYEVRVGFPVGTHLVCVYAIDVPVGANPALGCRYLTR